MVTCPACNGQRLVSAFINRGPDIRLHSVEEVKCHTCNGVGEITEERARRMAIGKRRRDERVARRVSLFEEAKTLDMNAATLSAIERGEGPDEFYIDEDDRSSVRSDVAE